MFKKLSVDLINRKLVFALVILTGLMLMLCLGLVHNIQDSLDQTEKANDVSYFSVQDSLGQPIFEQQYDKNINIADANIVH